MQTETLEYPAVGPAGFQPTSRVTDAAVAHNKPADVDALLAQGHLLDQMDAFFGSAEDGSHWAWRFPDRQEGGPVVALIRSVVGSRPTRPAQAPLPEWGAAQASFVWAGQPEPEPWTFNTLAPRWRPSRRVHAAPAPPSFPRFGTEEELVGRIESIDRDGQTTVCTVWPRRMPRDRYDAEIVLSEFPELQKELIVERAIFYWTFGRILYEDGSVLPASRIVMQRRIPIPPEQWEALDEEAAERAARYAERSRLAYSDEQS